MHWSIPAEIEDANEGGTFYYNACLRDGLATEAHKKVTCKHCKSLLEWPTNSSIISAKFVQTVVDLIEEGRKSDFFVHVRCNACVNDVDVSDWADSVQTHDLVARARNFLEHCAYEHMGGAEPMILRESDFIPVYGLNLAMGKPAMTMHEEAWRERTVPHIQASRP